MVRLGRWGPTECDEVRQTVVVVPLFGPTGMVNITVQGKVPRVGEAGEGSLRQEQCEGRREESRKGQFKAGL